MRVITRSGEVEDVSFDKITERLKQLSFGLNSNYVDYTSIARDTIARMPPLISTEDLDNLAADVCATQIVKHPDFNKFAARITVSNLHKSTHESFYTVMQILYQTKNSDGEHTPIISKELWELTKKNKKRIEAEIDFSRDYNFDFFGIKTLERAYLLRQKVDLNIKTKNKDNNSISGKIIERPQHMWMRVSLGIHGDDLDSAFESYHLMSKMCFTHATPTLFNSGTPSSQLSSCFLLGMDDSIKGIYKTLSDCAEISKRAGGIGIHINAIRSKGSIIKGTNGRSDGVVPMCRVINETATYVNQSGKRKGSIAVYIEPWHADIESFVKLRHQTGDQSQRAQDLFLALWIPDLFMERVKTNGYWSLMCPDECKGLVSTYGEEFNELYKKYEEEGKYKKKIKAQDLWFKIMESQIKTGLPYMAYKDSVNKKTNQNNLGVIRSSNLCCEIVQYSSDKEYSVCNLASISLPKCINYPKIGEKIKIYTKDGCKYCKMSKQYLTNLGYEYEEILMNNDEERKKFYKKENVNTVPQIYIGEERIGGYIEIIEENRFKLSFDFKKLRLISRVITKNLNKIIDINFYPVYETKLSNLRHRPMGIGIQGLADVYNILELSWGSEEATNLNKKIFETIYYESLKESNRLAIAREKGMKRIKEILSENVKSNKLNNKIKDEIQKIYDLKVIDTTEYIDQLKGLIDNKKFFIELPDLYNSEMIFDNKELQSLYHKFKPLKEEIMRESQLGSYASFIGSNFSKGKFQFNLWGLKDKDLLMGYDWDKLRENVLKHGTRNSLLTALMPTASTSQILGNNECFEPYTSNLYVRTTLAGEYIVMNKHLVKKLMELGLWTDEIRNEIIYFNGSIREIKEIPSEVKEVFMTSYDMPQKLIVQQSIDRGPFIDQSQSMNIFSDHPNYTKLNAMHFYGWKNGLKTGLYYLRSKPSVDPIKFGIDSSLLKKIKRKYKQEINTDLIEDDTSSICSINENDDYDNYTNTNINNRSAYEVCDVCSG